MYHQVLSVFRANTVWNRLITLSIVLFFTLLADAILSYWVPVYFEDVVAHTGMVGLLMSVSSIVGLGADLILPQVIAGITVKRLVFISIILTYVFSSLLYVSTWMPVLVLLLASMAVWGVYYEVIGFAQQEFVAQSTPLRFHASAWGVVAVFKSTAYFLGPLLSGFALTYSTVSSLYLSMFFAFIAALVLVLYHDHHARAVHPHTAGMNIFSELKKWQQLFPHVWPVLVMSLLVGVIDSAFWTLGPILTETLSTEGLLGRMFLSVFVLPSIFMGVFVARWGVFEGKKHASIILLLISGILLGLLGLSDHIIWLVGVTFFASAAVFTAFPLIEAVYSDLVSRMGNQEGHMIGLSSSTISIAYIVGPPLAGVIADGVGMRGAFAVIGIITAVSSVVLWLLTPRKLHLPQREMKRW